MIKKAVILCGGLATRLLPITKTIPKEMIPILNKPAIEYCIEDLKANGVTDILIIIGRNKECLENYFDHNIETEQKILSKPDLKNGLNSAMEGVNVYFMRQKTPKGTGYAVLEAEHFVGNEPFLVIYPDELMLGQSFAKTLINEHKKTGTSILPVKRIPIKNSKKYGMVSVENNALGTKILKIVEKPLPENSPSNICYTGGGLFTPDVFDFLDESKTHNGEVYLTDAFEGLSQKNNLYGTFLTGARLDIGNPLGVVKANILAALKNPEMKDDLIGFIKTLKERGLL